MSIHLYIEHLVLEGLPVEAGDGPAVRAAVEAELTRLLGDGGVAPALRQGGALASARGTDFRLPATPGPELLGKQIGAAIHRSLLP